MFKFLLCEKKISIKWRAETWEMVMLCDECCKHMHREIHSLNGGTTNLLAYGCNGNGCDFSLRQALDEYSSNVFKKLRDERNEHRDKGSLR